MNKFDLKKPDLVDFHRGWMIELNATEQGFQAACYSPCRKRLVTPECHGSDFDALYAAKCAIDYQLACSSLTGALYEIYETGSLQTEEWHSLRNSLN